MPTTAPPPRHHTTAAHPKDTTHTALADIAGFAIWASVPGEVDLKIREQIKTGTFEVRLKAEDWTSGPVNWLLDVIAPDRKATGQVIANFRQVVKEGDLRIHPIVAGLVDEEMRGKMMNKAGVAEQ
jgi:cytolysin-activating lysine-acyltransferase